MKARSLKVKIKTLEHVKKIFLDVYKRQIREGYHEDVDKFRRSRTDGKKWLTELEAREKERTGIKNLKIKYNRVFGYSLEVTNSFKELVPENYIRKQTLTNAERYITQELKLSLIHI